MRSWNHAAQNNSDCILIVMNQESRAGSFKYMAIYITTLNNYLYMNEMTNTQQRYPAFILRLRTLCSEEL